MYINEDYHLRFETSFRPHTGDYFFIMDTKESVVFRKKLACFRPHTGDYFFIFWRKQSLIVVIY